MHGLRGEDLAWLTGAEYACWLHDWAATACAAVLQSLPVSCHFRGCKVPLFRTVSGAISSGLALPLLYLFYEAGLAGIGTQGRLLHINDGANAPWKK